MDTAHREKYDCKQSSETLMSGRCKNSSGTTVSVELLVLNFNTEFHLNTSSIFQDRYDFPTSAFII